MAYHVIVHQLQGEPIEGEIDEMPQSHDTMLVVRQPQRRSNRDIEWLDPRTDTMIVPFVSILSVEVLPAQSEQEILTKTRFDSR